MNRQSANEKEKIDRHIVLDIDSEENYELFERLGKALSSRVRIRMLALLKHKSMNIVELAQELTIPVSSAAFHVNMLEEANLINTEMLPGVRGSQKVCSSRAEDVFLSINTSPQEKERRSFSVDMPIGNYYDFRIHPTCGMVNEETYIDSCDDIKSFLLTRQKRGTVNLVPEGFCGIPLPEPFHQRQKSKLCIIQPGNLLRGTWIPECVALRHYIFHQ